MTKCAPVEFNPQATCERWLEYLARVQPKEENRKFLQRLAKPIVVLYLGDFDPKGLDIERAARKGNDKIGDRRREGLFDILIAKHGWTAKRVQKQIRRVRAAATEQDVHDTLPLTISEKESGLDESGEEIQGDSTAPAYIERYGKRCLEIEALEVSESGELTKRLDPCDQKIRPWSRGRGCLETVGRNRSRGKTDGTFPAATHMRRELENAVVLARTLPAEEGR